MCLSQYLFISFTGLIKQTLDGKSKFKFWFYNDVHLEGLAHLEAARAWDAALINLI